MRHFQANMYKRKAKNEMEWREYYQSHPHPFLHMTKVKMKSIPILVPIEPCNMDLFEWDRPKLITITGGIFRWLSLALDIIIMEVAGSSNQTQLDAIFLLMALNNLNHNFGLNCSNQLCFLATTFTNK